MDDKVIIKAIKRSSCKEIENSVYKFEEDLELMQLLDVADGSRDGSVEEEKLEAQAGHHAMMGRRRRAHHDVNAHQDGQGVEGLRRVRAHYDVLR